MNSEKEKRRAVACKSCHSLKVKCKASDPLDPTSACLRCLKSGRNCEFEPPVTKRRKRPEDRVVELEMKLEKLTSQLQQSSSNENSPFPTGTAATNTTATGASSIPQGASVGSAEQQQQGPQQQQQQQQQRSHTQQIPGGIKLTSTEQLDQLFGPNVLHDISNAMTLTNEMRLKSMRVTNVDLIADGIISLQEAQLRYQLYTTVLYNKVSFIKITSEFEQLRLKYPTLFLTIMAVTSILREDGPPVEVNIKIENLAQQQILDQVLIVGNKTMELFQSLLIWTLWYNTPEMFHHRRYHIFSSLCVGLAFDLGLTGRPYYVVDRNEGSFQRRNMLDEPQKEEYRILVLAVYCLSTSFSLFLRRRLIVSWSSYLDECVQVLRSSQDPRHRAIGVFSQLTSMMEKIDNLIEPTAQVNYPLVKHMVNEITELRYIETSMDYKVMQAFASSIEAFLYSKFATAEMSFKCLGSCAECLQSFSDLSTELMASIPLMICGRLMYCFALYLKTVNFLKTDIDLLLVKRLFDKLQACSTRYPNVHVIIKVRLLLHFYLTTFVKNGDIFNYINEDNGPMPAKNMGPPPSQSQPQHQSQSQSQPQSQPQLFTGNSSGNGGVTQQQPTRGSPVTSGNINPTIQGPPQVLNSVQQPVVSYGPMNNSGQVHSNVPSPQQQQIPQQQQVPQQQHQHETQAPFDFNGIPPQSVGTPYKLDMLSDATMKGFEAVNEQIPTDDFWKIFDYKMDDQFYL